MNKGQDIKELKKAMDLRNNNAEEDYKKQIQLLNDIIRIRSKKDHRLENLRTRFLRGDPLPFHLQLLDEMLDRANRWFGFHTLAKGSWVELWQNDVGTLVIDLQARASDAQAKGKTRQAEFLTSISHWLDEHYFLTEKQGDAVIDIMDLDQSKTRALKFQLESFRIFVGLQPKTGATTEFYTTPESKPKMKKEVSFDSLLDDLSNI